MEIELQAILEVGAGICLGCLVAGAAFWIYALRRSKLKSSKETELPVYLGRDLKQAAILRKGSGSPDEESNSASSISRGDIPSQLAEWIDRILGFLIRRHLEITKRSTSSFHAVKEKNSV